ncbi:glycoside hydrolase family 10 protein [Brucella anthropi]|uniref:glycoside hydrolase family 10 protein n=1 Tax=Brucella anthropi TaxID=529 RepID=UPI003985BC02
MVLDCNSFHAAWVSTVINLDWPSRQSTEIADDAKRITTQKGELLAILDRAKMLGINGLIFQVSPTADAFYQSSLLPWSSYLTGTLGKNPGFDPLKFLIAEAHKRGIEIHAWINPYRVSMNIDPQTRQALENSSPDSPSSVYKLHPEWIGIAAKRYVLDPGIPAVREWVGNVVGEVVQKYDVDGIQFDDYFYYQTPDSQLDDSRTFARYGTSFKSKGDWRRYNTYTLVQEVFGRIKKIKPNIRFGISPGGVWRNKKDDPLGSDTLAGATNYDNDFADTRRWVKDGIIDYIAPQVYWPLERKIVPYGTIVKWWAETVRETPVDLYVGMALYKAGQPTSQEPQWGEDGGLTEIRHQLELNQVVSEVKGSILFREAFLREPKLKKIADYLAANWGRCRPQR